MIGESSSDKQPLGETAAVNSQVSTLGQLIIVDDEQDLLHALRDRLASQGYQVAAFSSARAALQAIQEHEFDLLLTDMMMPEMDGLTLLRAARETNPHLVAVMMTGQGSVQTAVDAMKLGAVDYILKPFKTHAVLPILARALEMRRLRLENLSLRETVAVHDLCRALAFSLDLNDLLNKIVDAALQQCEADEASLMLPTNDGKELYISAIRGKNREGLLGERVSMMSGIAGWVARECQPVVLRNEVQDARFTPHWPRKDIRAAVSLPMLGRGKLVGVLNVNTTSQRTITMGQVKALNILASVGGAAIQSAHLYAEVRQAEEKFRSIFESIAEGIFRITPDGRLILANPAMARMLGYPSPPALLEEVVDVQRQLFVEPDHWVRSWRRLEKANEPRRLEEQFRRKDGSICWQAVKVRAVQDVSGQVAYYEGSAEDITEHKQAERRQGVQYAMGRILAEARNLAEAAPRILQAACADSTYQTSAFWSVDAHAQLLRCAAFWPPGSEHTAFAQATWQSTFRRGEGLTGRVWQSGQPVSFADVAGECQCPRAAVAQAAGLRSAFAIPIKLDQDVLGVLEFFSLEPHALDEQLLQMFAVIGSQIGQFLGRRRLEENLRQTQKMEAIGVLAGGVAHDFNNLLTIINGYSEVLLNSVPRDDPSHNLLVEIRNAGERSASLTRQLLAFSRKQVVAPRVLDLNEVAVDTEKLLRRLIGEDVQLNMSLAARLGSVLADAGQIEQVLLNLAVNARDAMPRGGKLTIETQNVELDDKFAQLHADVQPGIYVLLAVSDTGCGMTAEVKARIFEPFFTTKEVGKGTGLGLATVFGIVKQCEGFVDVYSEVGVGTTFKIYLPQTARSADGKMGSIIKTPPKGTETVLLVEDDDAVRAVTRHVLVGCGYALLDACDGEGALRVATRHEGLIHLLVTDVIMPGLGGRELAERLRTQHPEAKVLYLSGYTDDAIVRHGVLHEEVNFLQKPFSTLALAQKVREVLNSR